MTTPLGRFRRDKDHYLGADPDSPLYGAAFSGLSYYPESAQYVVEAAFARFAAREVVQLATSSGDEQPYDRVGRATFELAGQACALTLYRPTFATANDRFFIPFQDATSGAETYGAGRYLEATLSSAQRVLLDFNYAYHPFCAYSERYRCPLPPAENVLTVPIYAGEKL